jgi:pimeloyl-ACP methyl ester carboxylesterase
MARTVLLLLTSIAALLAAPFALVAAQLLAVARTPGGKATAVAFLVGWLALAALAAAVAVRSRRLVGVAALIAVGAVVSWSTAVALAPDGRSIEASGVESVYIGTPGYRRSALANIVPEIDQFTLGAALLPAVDPVMDTRQATDVKRSFTNVYLPMRADPSFEALGSVMPYAYSDFVGGAQPEHYYVVTPPGDGPHPVVLFLHGSLGSFKGYTWVLRGLTERTGYAIVAPAGGNGSWPEHIAIDRIEKANAFIASRSDLDAGQVVLAGISQGGTAVSDGALQFPGAFTGLIYLSPVLRSDDAASLAPAWRDRPILIVTGGSDRRIPLRYVETGADILRDRGVQVTLDVVAHEDHFLLFSRPDETLDRVATWMKHHHTVTVD